MFNNSDLESKLIKAKQQCDDAVDKMKEAAFVFTKAHPKKLFREQDIDLHVHVENTENKRSEDA